MVEVDKKAEMLEVYDLQEDFLKVAPRGEIYKEIERQYEEKGKISWQLRTVRVIIMNTRGRILLQKRSINKRHNAGFYDKTLGGHCTHRQKADLALIAELGEELKAPGFVCESSDFLYNLKHIDLEVIGLFKNIGYESNWKSIRIGNSKFGLKNIEQPFMTHFYFGVYDGKFNWGDSEVRGMDSFTFEELKIALKESPDLFTPDLHKMISLFEPHIEAVLRRFSIN